METAENVSVAKGTLCWTVLYCTVLLLSLGYSTGTLMKETAERQELADTWARSTSRARAASRSLRSSR